MTSQLSLLDPPLRDRRDDRPGLYHRGGRDTERDAAELARPRSGTARARVLDALAAAGERGATDWELALATGLRLYTAAPRRVELLRDGWVQDSGRRRPTDSGTPAVVWRLSERGREQLEADPGRGAA